MGFGVAIMQPALPTLVRHWVPRPRRLATAVSTNGMLIGVAAGPALTIPLVLPLVGQSWRLDFLVWSVPGLIAALLFLAIVPRTAPRTADIERPARGAGGRTGRARCSGCSASRSAATTRFYYAVNAFLPDYLNSAGRADLIGPTLGWLNGSQLIASFVLLATADGCSGRAWPYLVFGPHARSSACSASCCCDGIWIVLAASVVGLLARRDLRGDVRAAAGLEPARRRASHGGRHVHHQLHHRRDRPGALRRALGFDRSAVDRVPAGRRCAPSP